MLAIPAALLPGLYAEAVRAAISDAQLDELARDARAAHAAGHLTAEEYDALRRAGADRRRELQAAAEARLSPLPRAACQLIRLAKAKGRRAVVAAYAVAASRPGLAPVELEFLRHVLEEVLAEMKEG